MKKKLICAFALLSFGFAFSQETSSKIFGRLKGVSSEVTVKVHVPTNSTFETKSNSKGQFSLITFSRVVLIRLKFRMGHRLFTKIRTCSFLGNNDLPVVEVGTKEKPLMR
jgi:hypothetical protein